MTEPIAPPTSVWTAINTGVNIDVEELAFDPDGDTLTTTAVTQGTNGSVVINLDGSVTYTPNSSFTGDDHFTYTVEDPEGNEASHTITVTIGPIDPVALDDEVTTPVNTAVEVEVLDLSFDPAGDTMVLTAITQGAHGTVAINLDGSVTYTPGNNFEGSDSFTYTVEDEDENPSTGTIEVTVGDGPPNETQEILDSLDAIEEEINHYDNDSPDTILGLVDTVATDLAGYLNEAMSRISANNISILGVNRDYPEFSQLWHDIYSNMYPEYMALRDVVLGFQVIGNANRILLEQLADQLDIAKNQSSPTQLLISQLRQANETLQIAQLQLVQAYTAAHDKMWKAWFEAFKTWYAWQDKAEPGTPKWLVKFSAPPQFPPLDTAQFLPRRNRP